MHDKDFTRRIIEILHPAQNFLIIRMGGHVIEFFDLRFHRKHLAVDFNLLLAPCQPVAALVALLGTLAGAGIGLGMASALAWRGRVDGALIPGAMLGGMAVGALGGTLGRDGIGLLTSQSIGAVAGLVEGLIMGGAIGAALWLAWKRRSGIAAGAILALAFGAFGGLLVDLAGGRLLGGSLYALQLGLGDTRLHLETLGAVFGESGFGPRTQMAATVTEAAILAAAMVCAVMLAFRARTGPQ